MTNTLTAELTRPIVGIENRTAQEVFDIMSDRIKRADLFAENAKNSTLPSPPVSGEAVAWLRDAHNGEGDECLVPCAKGDHGGFPVYASPITNEPVGVTLPRQVHSRHQWAQPGDEEHRTFILRFSDPDCREQVFTGKGAEQRAYDAWNLFSPNWNVYLFGTVPLSPSITGEKA